MGNRSVAVLATGLALSGFVAACPRSVAEVSTALAPCSKDDAGFDTCPAGQGCVQFRDGGPGDGGLLCVENALDGGACAHVQCPSNMHCFADQDLPIKSGCTLNEPVLDHGLARCTLERGTSKLCPDGFTCARYTGPTARFAEPVCVPLATDGGVCAYAGCDAGEGCYVNETYPGIVGCSPKP